MLDRGQKTVLILSPEAPYPATGGGALRTASLLHYLASRYIVDLAVFREPDAPDPARQLPPGLVRHLHAIDLPYHSRGIAARTFRNARRLVRGCPPLNDRFAGFGASLDGFLQGRCYEIALLEHFWCAPYFCPLAPHAKTLVLDLHNIESVFYASCARSAAWPAALAFRRFHHSCLALERRWFPQFSFLLAASDSDARAAMRIAPGCRCEVYPNAIPLAPEPQLPEEQLLVFSGNLEYYPNVSAVRFFRGRVWPLLADRYPNLRWRLVGKNPQAVAAYVRGDPRIEVMGPVRDALPSLAAAAVVVVPLLAGSGTRLKILEAWACGRAVVSTFLGAEGLPVRDGEHLLLADGPQDFARAVARLLDSPELRDRLGRAGRALYEEKFTWQAAWGYLARLGL